MTMKSITNYWKQIRFNDLIQYKCATAKHSLSFGLNSGLLLTILDLFRI